MRRWHQDGLLLRASQGKTVPTSQDSFWAKTTKSLALHDVSQPTIYWRIQHLLDRVTLNSGRPDRPAVPDPGHRTIGADRGYNLAAMSFVPAPWDQRMLTGEFNSQCVTLVLEAVRVVAPRIRLYQASSSEMYGKVQEIPQAELTPFYSTRAALRRVEGRRSAVLRGCSPDITDPIRR